MTLVSPLLIHCLVWSVATGATDTGGKLRKVFCSKTTALREVRTTSLTEQPAYLWTACHQNFCCLNLNLYFYLVHVYQKCVFGIFEVLLYCSIFCFTAYGCICPLFSLFVLSRYCYSICNSNVPSIFCITCIQYVVISNMLIYWAS